MLHCLHHHLDNRAEFSLVSIIKLKEFHDKSIGDENEIKIDEGLRRVYQTNRSIYKGRRYTLQVLIQLSFFFFFLFVLEMLNLFFKKFKFYLSFHRSDNQTAEGEGASS